MPAEKWGVIDKIYKAMPGWKGYINDGCPIWKFDGGEFISASAEPSGLVIESDATQSSFDKWIAEFVSNASEQLGFVVGDADV